jgi:hypothetical protein
MNSPNNSCPIVIPHEICQQEAEIELMFRRLARSSDRASSHHSRHGANHVRERRVVTWLLIATLGFTCIIAVYLLWLKTTRSSGQPSGAGILDPLGVIEATEDSVESNR